MTTETGGALTVWRRTIALVYPVAPRLVVGLAATALVTGLLSGANVAALGYVVGSVAAAIEGGGWGSSIVAVGVLGGLQLVGQIAAAVSAYLNSLLTDKMANTFSLLVARKSAALELPDVENPEVYDKLQVASREAPFRPTQIVTGSIAVIQSLVSAISVFVVVAQWSLWVALVIVLAPVGEVVVSTIMNSRMWGVEIDRTEKRRMAQYLSALVTTDRSFKEVKSFGIAPTLLGRYRALLDEFYEVDRKLHRTLLRGTSAASLVEVVFYLVAVVLAVQNSIAAADIGRLSGFIAGLGSVSTAVAALLGGVSMLHQNGLFLGNVFEFLDRPPTEVRGSDGVPPRRLDRGLSVRGVGFTYPGRAEPALVDIELDVPAGSTVALVGANGSGKTTLVKLLARLYEPSRGEILLDDRPIQEFDVARLRSSMAVLYQDFNRYELPLRDNIGFGDEAARQDDAELWRVLRAVEMDSTVGRYPAQLDQQLGRFFEGGIQPSGGQWQRLGIARALLRDAAIVILDEPTAALDPEGEEAIFRLLVEESDAIRVLVSHRFSTVRHADLICVVSDGRITERGTHDELMAQDGHYATMFRTQARGYVD